MRNFIRSLALVAMTGAAVFPVAAATPGEFYTSLLRRGVASYDMGRYDESRRLLNLAAFGLVDAVPQYELAQLYLALAFDRLGDRDHATEATRRLVVADRIGHSFNSLMISPAVRTAFETLAGQLLTPTEFAALTGRAAPAPEAAPAAETKARPPDARRVSPPKKAPPKRARAAAKPPQTTVATTVSEQPATPSSTTPAASVPAQSKAGEAAGTRSDSPSTAASLPPASTSANSSSPAPETPAQPTAAVPATVLASNVVKTNAPAASAPAPARVSDTSVAAPKLESAAAAPPQNAAPQTVTPPAPRTATVDIDATLAAASLALRERRLTDAQQCYRQLVAMSLPRRVLLQVAEGLYRSRDFQGVLTAFRRLEPLQPGEEPYRFYQAVAYYENGQFVAAKRELNIALAFIANTPDVARYRAKIEAAK